MGKRGGLEFRCLFCGRGGGEPCELNHETRLPRRISSRKFPIGLPIEEEGTANPEELNRKMKRKAWREHGSRSSICREVFAGVRVRKRKEGTSKERGGKDLEKHDWGEEKGGLWFIKRRGKEKGTDTRSKGRKKEKVSFVRRWEPINATKGNVRPMKVDEGDKEDSEGKAWKADRRR